MKHADIPEYIYPAVMDALTEIIETECYNVALREAANEHDVNIGELKFYVDRWNRESKGCKRQEEFYYIFLENIYIMDYGVYEEDPAKHALRTNAYVQKSTDRKHAEKQAYYIEEKLSENFHPREGLYRFASVEVLDKKFKNKEEAQQFLETIEKDK